MWFGCWGMRVDGRGGAETFGDVEGGEEDCFEHSMGFVGLHMP